MVRLNDETRREMTRLNDETNAHLRVLHEEVISRIALLQEGRPTGVPQERAETKEALSGFGGFEELAQIQAVRRGQALRDVTRVAS